jgi:hypothetical protein
MYGESSPSASPAAVPVAADSGPTLFVENVGQFDPRVRFRLYGASNPIWLTEDAIWITVFTQMTEKQEGPTASVGPSSSANATPSRTGVNLRLSFAGANTRPRLEPFDALDTSVSYFFGQDEDDWFADVPVWGGVRYVEAFPGIDLVLVGGTWSLQQQGCPLEGSGLRQAKEQLQVEGADALGVRDGQVLVIGEAGELMLPPAYSDSAHRNTEPSGPHPSDLDSATQYESRSQPAVASSSGNAVWQPELVYSTLLGGAKNEWSHAIAVDDSGAAYVAGSTFSPSFPTTPGAFSEVHSNSHEDVFVSKISPNGSGLLYSTFLGGTGDFSDRDCAGSIAVDDFGNAYVGGTTESPDFPTTSNAFDNTHNGYWDAFVTKIGPQGASLAYSTYLGGSFFEMGKYNDAEAMVSIAIDPTGAAYVAGGTASDDFPLTSGALSRPWGVFRSLPRFGSRRRQPGPSPEALDKHESAGTIPIGAPHDIVSPSGPWPYDLFVVKLTPDGSDLVYSSVVGRMGDYPVPVDIAVDGAGAAYITGRADDPDFPTTPGAYDTVLDLGDVFVTKINPSGEDLSYSTFLGGSDWDSGRAIAVDTGGAVYVTGRTESRDFPTTPGAYEEIFPDDALVSAFVSKLNSDGTDLVYSTFIDPLYTFRGLDIAVDRAGCAYVAGHGKWVTGPWDLSEDAFACKLAPDGTELDGRVLTSGPASSEGGGIALDSSGGVYVTGWAGSYFSGTTGAYDTTFNGGQTDAFAAKLIEAPPDIGFNPGADGYRFCNGPTDRACDPGWGEYPFPPALGDFTRDDMVLMFGEDAVCAATVGPVCLVKPIADLWLTGANFQLNNGRCDGMAVISLRFFKDLDKHPGVPTVHDLELGNEITASVWDGVTRTATLRRHITFHQVLQVADHVWTAKEESRQNAVSTILHQLRSAMSADPPDLMTLFVRDEEDGPGHTLVPYAIEDEGNGQYCVRVYDSNHPDDAHRCVSIDILDETWTYFFLNKHVWLGVADSHTLGIVPISQYERAPASCPWCSGTEAQSSEAALGQIWLRGGGHLLVGDSRGRCIGYVDDQFIDEAPGAYASVIDGGLGTKTEPIYTIPLTDTYSILLDGQTLTQTVTTAVTQYGPGYAVSVADVALTPGSADELVIVPEGTGVAYQPSSAKEATLTLALDYIAESYQLSVREADVGAGQLVTMTADSVTGRAVFDNSQTDGGVYDLSVRRVSSTGSEWFAHAGIAVSAGDTHYADYEGWDGEGALTLQIDRGSDGSIDEAIPLENELERVYLPLVARDY